MWTANFSRVQVHLDKGASNLYCDVSLNTVVDFFNRINVIYGVVSEFCTDETCPTMSGGAK